MRNEKEPQPDDGKQHVGRLRVSNNGRFLVYEDGSPFFYLADTAWELFHRLDRKDAGAYLANRAQKGFTVIQAVVLAEEDGLNTPNAYGKRPLIDNDPHKPDETYFAYVDEIIQMAANMGLYVGLLPTWGDKIELLAHGKGPIIFNADNAFAYGQWIGSRYRDYSNIIWINGGDRSGEGANYAVWDSLACGIKSVDRNHLMTFHPPGGGGKGHSSSQWFHSCPWLDFNMAQSGHERKNLPNYELIEHDYRLTPIKPCMDGEPRYEDHCVNWNPDLGWFDDYDVRQAAYWGLFAGGHGHTYGCHAIWQFLTPERPPVGKARGHWRDAMDLPGAGQMRHVRTLMESRPILSRIPDQSLVEDPGAGAERIMATRGDGYIFIYLPVGNEVCVNLAGISGSQVTASWFDPRNGRTIPIGPYRKSGWQAFMPPAKGRGNDWILILHDDEKGYSRTVEG